MLAVGTLSFIGLQTEAAFAKKAAVEGLKGPASGVDYLFYYPLTWDSVYVDGVDQVYMDIVEQLDNLSLRTKATDVASLEQLGTAKETAEDLTKRVIVTKDMNEYEISDVEEVTKDGWPYYQWAVRSLIDTKKAPGLKAGKKYKWDMCCTTIRNGKIYFFRAGTSEARESIMKNSIIKSRDSFKAFENTST